MGVSFPGALTPDELFRAVRGAEVLIDEAPAGAWGLDSSRLVSQQSPGPELEYVVSNRGGYVTGFERVFDPASFSGAVEEPERLDPLTQWLLHCTSVALREAGVEKAPPGTGFIVGNLSYPTVEHTRLRRGPLARLRVPRHPLRAVRAPCPTRETAFRPERRRTSSRTPSG